MKKILIALLMIAFVAIFATGCVSTAGPFVSNVTTGAPGTLTVERCMVEWNPWTNAVQTGNCNTSTVGIR